MTPTDLRALADRVASMTQTGAYIAPDRVDLYAEALRALAREREKEQGRWTDRAVPKV